MSPINVSMGFSKRKIKKILTILTRKWTVPRPLLQRSNRKRRIITWDISLDRTSIKVNCLLFLYRLINN